MSQEKPLVRQGSFYTLENSPDSKIDLLERIADLLEGFASGGGAGLVLSTKDLSWLTLAVIGTGQLASNNQLSDQPVSGSAVQVVYNGSQMTVGNGDKVNCSFYFSADNGVTAKTYSNIAKNDRIYFNAGFAGFPLDAGEKLSIYYLTLPI